MKVAKAIEYLKELDKDSDIVITWWLPEDFLGMEIDRAFDLAEEQLNTCIGHVNDWVADQY